MSGGLLRARLLHTDALSALTARSNCRCSGSPFLTFFFSLSLSLLSSDRSTSHVCACACVYVWESVWGGEALWSHRSLGGVLLMSEVPRLSRDACELKPSQVNAVDTDHSHCHVGISPALNSCFSDWPVRSPTRMRQKEEAAAKQGGGGGGGWKKNPIVTHKVVVGTWFVC